MLSYAVTISVECDSCRAPTAVNGIVEAVRCARCDAKTTLDRDEWERIGCHLDLANPQRGKNVSRSGKVAGLHANRRVPGCHACGKELGLDTAGLPALADAGRWSCATCGAASRVRAAAGLVLAFYPYAHFVIGEVVDGDEQPAAARGAIEVPCPHCGAAVTTDGTSRDVTCTYCNKASYLADDVWQRLHPVREQAFFLICADADEIATSERDLAAAALARFANDALTAAEFGQHVHDPNEAMRAAIAGNPHAPGHILFTLAQDKRPNVRAAVARNPAASAKALGLLASDEALQKTLIARADLPAPVLKQLALEGTNAVRELVVAHPALELAVLQQLAGDKKPAVRAAARARLREIAASGVDVNAGRGFFTKLFDRW